MVYCSCLLYSVTRRWLTYTTGSGIVVYCCVVLWNMVVSVHIPCNMILDGVAIFMCWCHLGGHRLLAGDVLYVSIWYGIHMYCIVLYLYMCCGSCCVFCLVWLCVVVLYDIVLYVNVLWCCVRLTSAMCWLL